MILIFGGAYQGKLEYAIDNCKVNTVYDCSTGAKHTLDEERDEMAGPDISRWPRETTEKGAHAPDLSADAIYGLEVFALKCVKEGLEASDWFKERWDEWQDKVLIICDQSQGIVPVDAETRAAREMNGRLMIYLANEAEQVIRVFCGLGKRIK